MTNDDDNGGTRSSQQRSPDGGRDQGNLVSGAADDQKKSRSLKCLDNYNNLSNKIASPDMKDGKRKQKQTEVFDPSEIKQHSPASSVGSTSVAPKQPVDRYNLVGKRIAENISGTCFYGSVESVVWDNDNNN